MLTQRREEKSTAAPGGMGGERERALGSSFVLFSQAFPFLVF